MPVPPAAAIAHKWFSIFNFRLTGTSPLPSLSPLGEQHRGNSSVGRAAASQAAGHGFEPRLPLLSLIFRWPPLIPCQLTGSTFSYYSKSLPTTLLFITRAQSTHKASIPHSSLLTLHSAPCAHLSHWCKTTCTQRHPAILSILSTQFSFP